ncbi:MAG: peptide chain release factor-like protein [Planctomycetota bacterium]
MTEQADDHPAAWDEQRLLRGCVVERTRGSGPGGQRRNKVATGVRVRHEPTGLVAEAGERREPEANRRVAVFRLRVLLALEVRVGRAERVGPSALWRSRCVGGRVSINPEHADFPAVLAEMLDVLAMKGWDLGEAAGAWGGTGSQWVKVLKAEPRALEKLNAERVAVGLGRLR